MTTASLTLLHAPEFIDGAHDALLPALARHLSPDEQARLPGFVRQRRRREFILGRLLLRHGAARSAACPIQQIEVLERPGAGPQIVVRAVVQDTIQASLSHAGGWIACAIGAGFALGVDIETSDAGRDLAALAQTALGTSERRWLDAQRHRESAFYQLWCGKESLYKYRNNAGLPASPGLPQLLCDDIDGAPRASGAVLSSLHDGAAGMHLSLCCPAGTDVITEKIMVDALLERFTWGNK